MNLFKKVFCSDKKTGSCQEQEKAIRDNMSNKQHDKILKDSFPASDPPSTY